MKKWLFRVSLSIAVLAGALLAGVYIYLQHPKVGELPSGDRLNRIKASPHYANGRFQNLVPTPVLVGDSSLVAGLLSAVRTPAERLTAAAAVPSVKTNLNELDRNKDVLVWIGHSSYFVQLGGVRVLRPSSAQYVRSADPLGERRIRGNVHLHGRGHTSCRLSAHHA